MASPEELEQEREKHYGNPWDCHSNIASAWGGYLNQVVTTNSHSRIWLSPEDVANLLALMKIIRAGYDSFHQDNYDDAITYLTFARRFTCGETKGQQSNRSTTSTEANQGSDAPRDGEGIRSE